MSWQDKFHVRNQGSDHVVIRLRINKKTSFPRHAEFPLLHPRRVGSETGVTHCGIRTKFRSIRLWAAGSGTGGLKSPQQNPHLTWLFPQDYQVGGNDLNGSNTMSLSNWPWWLAKQAVRMRYGGKLHPGPHHHMSVVH